MSPHSLAALAEAIIQASGGGKYEIGDARAQPNRFGDFLTHDYRFRSISGWRPRTSLANGLRRSLEYYQTILRAKCGVA